MNRYTNLLVAIDPDHEEQPAFTRALDIAKKSSVTVKITLFLAIYDLSYEMTSILSSDERQSMRCGVVCQRRQWISSLVSKHTTNEVNISNHVVWHNRPYESMIAQVFNDEHDLLIKVTHKHAKLGAVIFTPADWHLLRKCPCPVLLVKGLGWPENGKILTAVNVSSENEAHILLNNKLIDESKAMSKLLNAEVNLVNAYPATPVNVTIELPERNPASYTDGVRDHHLLAMKALRQKHSINEEQTFCQEGLPEDVIPEVAKKLDAGLVILGTTGRLGLSAFFMGNTAEHTIDQLNCDVLAIKPDGYVSPLTPNVTQ
ncbi:universal stress protein UspE [Candidatus Enterovibrio escicola]|uniref:Universal stress protein E n=1 Tax=Candidatus Enterovibrio escicola TaxID=1927127 RepID=A0A2A5T309_9GAMM|nr:universal stress protein UspE [Candidatus Enterovibrio escacola]PCS22536.1 Universal stress protein E [Candidatus Enterovibrio escacola]